MIFNGRCILMSSFVTVFIDIGLKSKENEVGKPTLPSQSLLLSKASMLVDYSSCQKICSCHAQANHKQEPMSVLFIFLGLPSGPILAFRPCQDVLLCKGGRNFANSKL